MINQRKGVLSVVLAVLVGVGMAALRRAHAQIPDPGASGPFTVARAEYDFGDTAFTATGFPGPIEVRASVHYPVNLAAGPFPFIVFLHGRHATCFTGGSAALEWPCTQNRQPIPSYQGYDYISEALATHGFIV